MSIQAITSDDGGTLTIAVSGKFDFNLYREFRSAYENCAESTKNFILDFKSTDYIDSSALGMMLVMREQTGGEQAKIKIVNSNPELNKILEISNFQQLFDIQ